MPTAAPESAASSTSPMVKWVADLGAFAEAFLSAEWVIFIVVPLLVTFGTVLIKAFARQSFEIRPEDKIVGFDLGITACITLLVSSLVLVNKRAPAGAIDPAVVRHYLVGIFIVLLIFVALLTGAAALFRKRGWKKGQNGEVLVVSPWQWTVNLGGLGLLVTAFNLTGGSFK